jgi:hypothetical protein
MPGLFAAGDVRHNSVKRCATAVGDGATAVSMVHRFFALESRLSLRSATGTSPERCSGIQQAGGPLAGRDLWERGEYRK